MNNNAVLWHSMFPQTRLMDTHRTGPSREELNTKIFIGSDKTDGATSIVCGIRMDGGKYFMFGVDQLDPEDQTEVKERVENGEVTFMLDRRPIVKQLSVMDRFMGVVRRK